MHRVSSDSCVVLLAPALRRGSAGHGTPSRTPSPLCSARTPPAALVWGVGAAHLEGDVVEVAAAANWGPAGLRGRVVRRSGAGARSPGESRPGPIGCGQRGGSGSAGPLAFGGLLPGHGGRALSELSLQPPRPGPPCYPHSWSATRTRTGPAAAAASRLAPRAPPPPPHGPAATQARPPAAAANRRAGAGPCKYRQPWGPSSAGAL